MAVDMTDNVHALISPENRPDEQGDSDGMVAGRNLEAGVSQVGLGW